MKIMKVGIVFAFVKLNFVQSDGRFVADVTNTRNGERGTGNGERESGN